VTVTVRNLTKRYGATLAIDDVSLEIRSGEIHALLGHNGAGKSTLIRCLGGGTAPSSGAIDIDGEPIQRYDPRESISRGIAVIYQHLSLIEGLSVADNLFLGQEITRAGVALDKREQHRRTRAALARVGSIAAPDTLVRDLSIGQRQLVEIAKALQRDAKLLVLDEPTAALSVAEADRLGELILDLRHQGMAILYVTHLLGEVAKLADQVTVLRNGRTVFHAPWSPAADKQRLVSVISDGAGPAHRRSRPSADVGPRFELVDVASPGLTPVSVTIAAGEVVALYGLMGAGRSRLLNTLFGRLERSGGDMRVDGQSVRIVSPASALAHGVALVPGDRQKEGLFASLPAIENTLIASMSKTSRVGMRNVQRERSVFDAIGELLSLRPHAPSLPAGRFSGGNQQKILLARWVNALSGIRVLLLDDPTQGVDVGARHEIYRVIAELAERQGLAVLVATNEPEEVMELAHRCLVMVKGRIVDEIDVAATSTDELLRAIHPDAATAA